VTEVLDLRHDFHDTGRSREEFVYLTWLGMTDRSRSQTNYEKVCRKCGKTDWLNWKDAPDLLAWINRSFDLCPIGEFVEAPGLTRIPERGSI